jgi:imidazolonepropionase-like amidohydrolase
MRWSIILKKVNIIVFLILMIIIPTSGIFSQVKVIRFGKLIDGTGKVLQNPVIFVKNNRILEVKPKDSEIPVDAEVFDLSDYTGIPGLIDVHVHMTYLWDRKSGTDPWNQYVTRPSEKTLFLAQENAKKTLECGVTTVRDLYALDFTNIYMRDLINSGAMIGPRMYVCGYGLHTGDGAEWGGHASGVTEVVRVVKEQIAAGADWIKIFGSTGSASDLTGFQTYTFEEMKAAVEVAHDLGKPVAVHSYGPEAARDAILAGAASIEHAVDLDESTIAEMVQQGTFYVPTIDHNRYYAERREEYGYNQENVKSFNEFIQRNLETLRKAYKAGVRIAMGSDAVFTMFGENTKELEWFVKAGMSPAEALTTATYNGALLLGIEDSLGKIAPGYYADIVALDGDPLLDIGVVINGVHWVMKDGVVLVDKTITKK